MPPLANDAHGHISLDESCCWHVSSLSMAVPFDNAILWGKREYGTRYFNSSGNQTTRLPHRDNRFKFANRLYGAAAYYLTDRNLIYFMLSSASSFQSFIAKYKQHFFFNKAVCHLDPGRLHLICLILTHRFTSWPTLKVFSCLEYATRIDSDRYK